MVRNYRRFCLALNQIYTYVGLLFLVIIIIASSIQVFTRYIMGAALVGSEEVSRYCFIWMTMLGACICVTYFTNANVSILNDVLKGGAKKIHASFIDVAVLIGAVVLAYQGLKMVQLTTGQLSSILRIPMSYVYLALPVSGIGMALNSIERILTRHWGKGEEACS